MKVFKSLLAVMLLAGSMGLIASCDASEKLCGPCGDIYAGDNYISGDARLDGVFKAVGTFGKATAAIDASFKADVMALGEVFGLAEADMEGLSIDALVAEVKGAITAEINANVDGSLQVEYAPPKCSADVNVSVEAQASCEASAGCEVDAECTAGEVAVSCEGSCSGGCSGGCEGELKCDAELSVTGKCSGSCEGSCEVTKPNMECEGTCSGSCTIAAGGECSGTCEGTCSGSCTVQVSGACTGTCEGTCDGTCTGETGEGGECNGECDGTCEGTCSVEGDASCEGTCEGTCDADCTFHGEAECSGTCNGSCSFTPPDGSCEGSCKGECKASVEAEADCEGEVKCEGSCTGECSGGCEGNVTPPSCSVDAECEASADCQASASAQASASVECTPPSLEIAFKLNADLDATAKAEFKAKMELFKVRMVGVIQGMFKMRALVDAEYAAEIGIEAPVASIKGQVEGLISGGIDKFDVPAGRIACVIPAFEDSADILVSAGTDLVVTFQAQMDLVAVLDIM